MKVNIPFEPDAGKPEQRASQPAPARVNKQARQLALAYHIEALIARGEMKDIAHVARVAGVSRARVSQVLDMTLLAPWVQEGILDGSCKLGAHALRRLAGMPNWMKQRWHLKRPHLPTGLSN